MTPMNSAIWSTKHNFVQDEDTSGRHTHTIQELAVESISVPGNSGKMDVYLVMTTERWAINPDEIDDFAAALKELCRRAYADANPPKSFVISGT